MALGRQVFQDSCLSDAGLRARQDSMQSPARQGCAGGAGRRFFGDQERWWRLSSRNIDCRRGARAGGGGADDVSRDRCKSGITGENGRRTQSIEGLHSRASGKTIETRPPQNHSIPQRNVTRERQRKRATEPAVIGWSPTSPTALAVSVRICAVGAAIVGWFPLDVWLLPHDCYRESV